MKVRDDMVHCPLLSQWYINTYLSISIGTHFLTCYNNMLSSHILTLLLIPDTETDISIYGRVTTHIQVHLLPENSHCIYIMIISSLHTHTDRSVKELMRYIREDQRVVERINGTGLYLIVQFQSDGCIGGSWSLWYDVSSSRTVTSTGREPAHTPATERRINARAITHAMIF